MNIEEYFVKLNMESQGIFEKSLVYKDELGKIHHFASCVYEFSEHILDIAERKMLTIVSSQLESATLSVTMGMYRQAFSSLRLALEMGLGVAYLSVNKLELHEWLDGRFDIKWSNLVDDENGVFSTRFSNAFCRELSPEVHHYRENAKIIYRELSEYVHGNNETWLKSGLSIRYNEDLLNLYFESFEKVSKIILFALCCRYLKSLQSDALESLEFIPEELHYIPRIREFFGGPKEL